VMEKIIDKQDLQKLLNDLKKKYEVIGPTFKGGGTARYSYPTFAPIDALDDLILNYGTTMITLKKIFFPDNQKLYQFEKSDDGIRIKNIEDVWNEKKVFFGVHPCDISALLCLDKVLLEETFVDERYKNKREKSVIIGLTCDKPHSSCFCNTSAAGPDIEKGYDLLMTDIGDKYYVKSGTALGNDFLSAAYFKEADEKEIKQRNNQLEKIRKALPEPLDIEKISKTIALEDLDELFKPFTNLCFTCGSCNMVCPTCHCFTITEKTNPEHTKGVRNLIWDSCHYEKFATMAGNVNARPDVKSRFKHRVFDKYYYDANRYGTIFCVGCGRCRDFCPGHMSIRDAVKIIQEK
jgi:sulfhydrogenase subunit beta (sulfur reductase)